MTTPTHTLQINITLNDLETFKASFSSNAGTRSDAGVLNERVALVPGGTSDAQQVVIELDFGAKEHAEAFLDWLRTTLWPSAPVVVGTPEARILEPLAVTV